MEAPLRAAVAGVAEVVPVSFGIDPTWYAIERPRIVEPPNRWVVVSRLTRNKIGPLFEWGQPAFASPERELHLYGPMEEEVELPGWVHYHGPASPRLLADEVFPAARGLITLSQHAEAAPYHRSDLRPIARSPLVSPFSSSTCRSQRSSGGPYDKKT